MQVRIVVVGAVRGIEQLTYSVPPELEGRVRPGHRVLAPLQSRKVTGVVLETAAGFPGANGNLKPILELLEPRPLFDRAHLQMMEFLSTYYMVALAEVYRSVIPAVARVESRLMYKLAHQPDVLRQAAYTVIEREIVEALAKHPLNSRQLARLGNERAVASGLAALMAEGLVEAVDSTRGRHRDASDPVVHLVGHADAAALRGKKQREIISAIAAVGGSLATSELEIRMPGARLALKVLERRGIIRFEVPTPAANVSPSNNGAIPQVLPSYELTNEQRAAVDEVARAIEEKRYESFLLYGVTGSGKTEV